MIKVLFNRNLCPLVLSHLPPNDQANARLVCTFWNSIVEKVFRRTEFNCVLKNTNTKEPVLTLDWTSTEQGGDIPIMKDIRVTVFTKGHQGYATATFDIKKKNSNLPFAGFMQMDAGIIFVPNITTKSIC